MKQLTLVLLLAQLSFANAAEQKLDVLGLFAGMPSSAIASLLKTKGWRCQNRNDPVMGKAPDPITGDFVFTCDTSAGQLKLHPSGIPERHTIVVVAAILHDRRKARQRGSINFRAVREGSDDGVRSVRQSSRLPMET